jgi:ATP-dependent RNA helicase RhlE
MHLKTFSQLNLIEPLLRAVSARNYDTTTPIQAETIPPLLAGRDVLGCAQTGTGKTAAFALPILQHISERPSLSKRPYIRALVLAPTRELAAQIGTSFEAYSQFLKIRQTVIFGGVRPSTQIQALKRGVDILVATPGRLLDLQEQGFVDLNQVEFFVLDEADRMLDMGFINDIRKIIKLLPERRQNLLFSATMPRSIAKLADSVLDQPFRFQISPKKSVIPEIQQEVMFVEQAKKRHLLVQIIRENQVDQAIVFMRTKHRANRLAQQLKRARISVDAIHGNKSQAARDRVLRSFRKGETRILVATDIAARGLDIHGVSHVFNFDLPNEAESYVHRIGRTGRAGRSGIAIAFCAPEEYVYLKDIEKLMDIQIPASEFDQGWDGPSISVEGKAVSEKDINQKPSSLGRQKPRSKQHNQAKQKSTYSRRKKASSRRSKSKSQLQFAAASS